MSRATYYDPDNAPDPTEWRALEVQERIRVVVAYHSIAKKNTKKPKVHALLHVNVENLLLQARGPATRAMSRLMKEGLTRHQAIHALATVWLAYPVDSWSGNTSQSPQEKQVAFNHAMENLSIDAWEKLKAELRRPTQFGIV